MESLILAIALMAPGTPATIPIRPQPISRTRVSSASEMYALDAPALERKTGLGLKANTALEHRPAKALPQP